MPQQLDGLPIATMIAFTEFCIFGLRGGGEQGVSDDAPPGEIRLSDDRRTRRSLTAIRVTRDRQETDARQPLACSGGCKSLCPVAMGDFHACQTPTFHSLAKLRLDNKHSPLVLIEFFSTLP